MNAPRNRDAKVSVASDGRIAIFSSDDGVFGQFDVDGVWHQGKVPSADEYMEEFGPLRSPTLRVLFLARTKAASAAAKAAK